MSVFAYCIVCGDGILEEEDFWVYDIRDRNRKCFICEECCVNIEKNLLDIRNKNTGESNEYSKEK